MKLSHIRARAGRVAHQVRPDVAGAFVSVDDALVVCWNLRPDQGRALAALVAALAVQAHVIRRLGELRAVAGELLAAARDTSESRAARADRERRARAALRRRELEEDLRREEAEAERWGILLAEMDAEADRGWALVENHGLLGLDGRAPWA